MQRIVKDLMNPAGGYVKEIRDLRNGQARIQFLLDIGAHFGKLYTVCCRSRFFNTFQGKAVIIMCEYGINIFYLARKLPAYVKKFGEQFPFVF